MKTPMLLPEDLLHYTEVESDAQLLKSLIEHPRDLIAFFEYACDDETWTEIHSLFMEEAVQWIHKKSYEGHLPNLLIQDAAKAIQRHYRFLESFLPTDITIGILDNSFEINSFLFMAASPFFYNLIRTNCIEKKSNSFFYYGIESLEFRIIQEYVYTGEVRELWNLQEEEIMPVLHLARLCQLPVLALNCEQLLLRYVNAARLMEFLKLADQLVLQLIKQRCLELMNQLHEDVSFKIDREELLCQFYRSTEVTREILTLFSSYITQFIAGNDVMEDKALIPVLNQCPRLKILDIGHTRDYTDLMLEVLHIRELILSGSLWLRDEHLKKMISVFEGLEKLDLTNCIDITAKGWGELIKLPRLRVLSLHGCDHLTDSALQLITAAARHLQELDLGGCVNLTHVGFQQLATVAMGLTALDLSRTALDDESLLEIVSRLPQLRLLNLTRCHNISKLGIANALKRASSLLRCIDAPFSN